MASTAKALTREEQVREVMRATNLLRSEAEAAAASRYGEDTVGVDGRLTPDQKRRVGLGRSIAEFMELEEARQSDGERRERGQS